MQQWYPLPQMNVRRACAGYVMLNNKLMVVGGKSFQQAEASVFEYDPVTGHWQWLPRLGTARRHCSAAVWNERFVVEFHWTTKCADSSQVIGRGARAASEYSIFRCLWERCCTACPLCATTGH